MDQEKKTYYISMGSGEISQVKTASPWDYEIQATEEEIMNLRECFDQNYSTDWQGFLRAHVPYVQYHYDPSNDAYDNTMGDIYQMIYDLGDEKTKEYICSQGILETLKKKTE